MTRQRTGRLALATALVAGTIALTGAAPAAAEPVAGSPPTTAIELAVPTTDGLSLPATLRLPDVPAPGRPAMVLVHGAGQGPREGLRPEAEAFAAAGVATLTYDRRTVGYSFTERSYSRLADDAVAAAAVLRAQPGVDPGRVGLWGLSEGGWVAPLAAARAPETAFLVVVGANGMGPLRQQVWAEAVKVQSAGVRGSLVDAASAGVYRLIADLGLFSEAGYDPGPVLRRLTLPVLGVWGAVDRSTPPVESVALFREALDQAGNPHYHLRTVAGAEHSLHSSVDGFHAEPGFAPGYVDLVGSWTSAAAAGNAPPSSVSGTGEQPRPTADVPPSAWWESAVAHGVVLVLMLGGFGGFALTAAIRRVARAIRPGTPREPAPVAARVLASTGPVAVLGTLVYLGSLTVVRGGEALDPGPLLAERPLPWLALQALAVITVLAAAALVARLVRRPGTATAIAPLDAPVPVAAGGRGPGTVRRPVTPLRSAGEHVRLAMLLVAAAAFVPWALYWGLLVP
jgi:uncharacterized protein